MKRWNDPFPPTPQAFHHRVEQTLGGLKESNMKHLKYHRLAVVAVAALITLLAIGAVAVVAGHSGLKQTLTEGGADEVAALVQELHRTDQDEAGADDGFGFSIDELFWEDDSLYLTYSLKVPEEGNYLAALFTPTINGQPMLYNGTYGFSVPRLYEEDRTVLVFGDETGRECTDLITFRVNSTLKQRHDNALCFQATLLRTDLEFESGSDFGVFLNPPESASLDVSNVRRRDGDPEYAALVERLRQAAGADGSLNLDELVDSGCAEIVAQRQIDMTLDAAALPQTVYNDVEAHDYDVRGVHLHIDSFHMTHMGIAMKYTISVPDAKSLDERVQRLNDFYPEEGTWDFGTIDGKALDVLFIDGSGGGGMAETEDGTIVYHLSIIDEMIIPLNGIRQIIFAPKNYPDDEDGNQLPPVYDLENAAVLTPVFNQALADQQALEAAERQEAVETYDGDPDARVYATENGIWYHTIPHCQGMRNAKVQSVAQAEASGKRPCPLCAGGADDYPPLEEGETNFSDISSWGTASP